MTLLTFTHAVTLSCMAWSPQQQGHIGLGHTLAQVYLPFGSTAICSRKLYHKDENPETQDYGGFLYCNKSMVSSTRFQVQLILQLKMINSTKKKKVQEQQWSCEMRQRQLVCKMTIKINLTTNIGETDYRKVLLDARVHPGKAGVAWGLTSGNHLTSGPGN